jgi:peptide/nickel transport system permease protein
MGQYVVRRLLMAIPLLFIISVLIFFGLRLSGADPVAYLVTDPRISEADRFLLRARYGLNDPLPLQFVHWLIGDDWYQRDVTGDGVPDEYGRRLGVLRGDWGESIRLRRPVAEVISQFLPNTLILGLSAYAVTLTLSMIIGVTAALRQYTWVDNLITTLSFITYSMPIFFIALLGVQIFAVEFRKLGLPSLPVQGMYDVRGDRSLDELIGHFDCGLQPLHPRDDAGSAQHGLHPYGAFQRLIRAARHYVTRAQKCLAAHRHTHRHRSAAHVSGRGRDRAYLLVAGDGSAVHSKP